MQQPLFEDDSRPPEKRRNKDGIDYLRLRFERRCERCGNRAADEADRAAYDRIRLCSWC
jgi:hypothetical protein